MGREQERSRMEDREGLVGPRIFFEEIVGPRICMLHVMSDRWAHGPSAFHNEKAQSMKRHVGNRRREGHLWAYAQASSSDFSPSDPLMKPAMKTIFIAGSTRTSGDILSRIV